MAQKLRAEKETKSQIQEKLIKSLRNVTIKYGKSIKCNVTAIDVGHKTGLY